MKESGVKCVVVCLKILKNNLFVEMFLFVFCLIFDVFYIFLTFVCLFYVLVFVWGNYVGFFFFIQNIFSKHSIIHWP